MHYSRFDPDPAVFLTFSQKYALLLLKIQFLWPLLKGNQQLRVWWGLDTVPRFHQRHCKVRSPMTHSPTRGYWEACVCVCDKTVTVCVCVCKRDAGMGLGDGSQSSLLQSFDIFPGIWYFPSVSDEGLFFITVSLHHHLFLCYMRLLWFLYKLILLRRCCEIAFTVVFTFACDAYCTRYKRGCMHTPWDLLHMTSNYLSVTLRWVSVSLQVFFALHAALCAYIIIKTALLFCFLHLHLLFPPSFYSLYICLSFHSPSLSQCQPPFCSLSPSLSNPQQSPAVRRLFSNRMPISSQRCCCEHLENADGTKEMWVIWSLWDSPMSDVWVCLLERGSRVQQTPLKFCRSSPVLFIVAKLDQSDLELENCSLMVSKGFP